MTVNLFVVCGFTACSWSMEIDPAAGADPMAVHEAYLEHLDVHDPDGTDCEAPEHWVNVAAAIQECSSCHAAPGQAHTEYCKLRQWEAHDAEVARALAEDKIRASAPAGGFYNGQLYSPPSFTCPKCSAVSHHPEDVKQGYCGRCHEFTGLYAGDTPSKIAADQARIDRFMAGDQDQ